MTDQPFRLVSSTVVYLLLCCIPLPADTPKKDTPRKIVLIAGELDGGHPKGTHEYEKSVQLLKHCLETSPNLKGVKAEVHLRGWPRDDSTLNDADTIVVVSSGSDRREQDHPLLVGDRLQILEKQMKRGCGLVVIHWTTFFPNAKAGEKALDWVGGHFDYQSGPPPRRWASAIQHVTTTAKPGTPDHPVCRGVEPFKVREEFYYHIRFRDKDPRLKPILVAAIPGEKKEQTVAWAVERRDGGRGFGFTGGHYFDNWQLPAFRKLVLNAIAWTAHADVPKDGVESTPPREAPGGGPKLPPPPGKLVLAEGRFGKALDARSSPAEVEGSDRFRKPPLTVECWAKLFSKTGFNVLVASDHKSSGDHWEVYSYAGSGAFSAYLPGMEPAEIVSQTDICDGKWHYLAMTYDGKTVRLHVDGKRVLERAVKLKAGRKSEPGPLTIGAALDGPLRIGCDGLIDDVRISSTIRKLVGVPAGPLPLDLETVGLWRFDNAEAADVDPAWTPRPVVDASEPWERETDKDWIDARFQKMDTGPYLNATIAYPGPRGKVHAYKGTAIRVGDKGEAAVLFDRGRLRLAAGWTGGYLTHSSVRFGLLNTPTPAGTMVFATENCPGWASPEDKWDGNSSATAPLPREWAKFRGLYLHGRRVVLSYTVGGVEVLDAPWAETAGGTTAITRTLEIAPSSRRLHLFLCDVPGKGEGAITVDGVTFFTTRQGDRITAVALAPPQNETFLHITNAGRAELTFAAHKKTLLCKVLLWQGDARELPRFAALLKDSPAPDRLFAWTKPGPARWTKPIVTRGAVAKDNAPFVIDTLTVPYDNPHNALMFISGIDFLPNGDPVVCTAHGDVWVVKGADDKLEKLTWKRFATGLYQPLGLKVVGGVVHVLERGQLTQLHDVDGDGEADYYECLCNDWHTGAGEHSFDTCLETDPQGNFYFFKTGDTELPTGGCLLRVSKDGTTSEIFATGFRHPIGLGISPDGLITGADQEGNWMPATRIDVYRKGGFYGDMHAHHRKVAPETYDPPLCWLPRQIDNSAGGQVWVPRDRWGSLGGHLLHLSYGRCRIMLVLRQEADGVMQGGAVDLGLQFLSGVCRARFRPRDGHLYLVGLRGWQTAAVRDGCVQRVRYIGGKVFLPVALSAHANGLRLTFSEKLDRRSAEDVKRYRVAQWNYHWSADYGSKRWSVAHPERVGEDAVPVRSVKRLADGRSVFVETPPLKAVMQMQVRYDLTTADGDPLSGVVYNTIHRPAPPPK